MDLTEIDVELTKAAAARRDNEKLGPLVRGMTVLQASVFRLDREQKLREMHEGFLAGSVIAAMERHAAACRQNAKSVAA